MASSSSGATGTGTGTGGSSKPKPLRHVYKTGAAGCGGKAAPTAAKNSGAPLPCPFCDRIFKQDGRLKEHLKNKHADESLEGPQTNGEADSAGAGNDNDQGQPQQQQSATSSYPIKTPKTLLHEWCQKNKRPVPKFKHVEEDGGFHCRVILPDPKKSEADVILWYRDTPTRSSQEAQHRAAVVGLHHVLGNRRLDRILAEEYKEQWHNLELVAEKRKAYLKAHPPQPKSKVAPVPRELHSVFMSEDNRRLVEGLLRDNDNGDETSSDTLRDQSDEASQSAESQQRLGGPVEISRELRIGKATHTSSRSKVQTKYTWEELESSEQGMTEMKESLKERRKATETQAVRRKLLSLGFTAHHVNLALVGRHDLSSALDWLILNVPEQELPNKFAPDASKASVQVLVRGKRAAFDVAASVDQDNFSDLQEYGYAFGDCVSAFSEANGDKELALCILFDSAFDGLRTHLGTENMTTDIAELYDIREDEQLALEAIYGQEAASISESLSVFEISIPEDSTASLSMEVRIPPGSRYPLEVPVVAFRSKELPAEYLLELTKRVVNEAAALVGGPMIYNIVHLASEVAQELVVNYVGLSNETKSSPEASLTYDGATELSDEEVPGTEGSVKVPNLSSLGNGDKLPLATAYIPPALRRLPRSAPQQSKDLEEVGVGGIQHPSQNSSKIKPTIIGVDQNKESAKLKMEWERSRNSGRQGEMWAVRCKLPAYQQRDSLLSTVNTHQVTIIAGQTGCGKSTQVPQYVLEDYIEKDKGALCNIICTQPRRLSAIGLADRVAKERGQSVGETVGYSVRLESNRSQRTRLLFCTTGILLRRLLSDPDLEGITHVIIDEVHERSLDSDLLLLLVRELLKRTGSRLRLILMSATVDTNLFLRYFREDIQLNPCVVSIPGFTFPVQEYYLEDALDLTGYKIGRNSRYAMRKKVSSSSDLPNLSASVESAVIAIEDMDNWESLAEDKAKEDTLAMDAYSEATIQSLSIVDQTLINYDLIELVICAILQDALPSKMSESFSRDTGGHRGNHAGESRPTGAVLVFLPGVAEIRRLQKQLSQSSQIQSSHSGSLWILALHGSLSSDEQRKVFSRPAPGCRKVVLATNIAETSVTIDDVVYVVDTGRHKEMRYDHSRGISCLEETWVSKASAKQRRGRAGRVQSGYCIRLFSRQQFQTFEDQQLPEILRVSLDGLCLKVKSFLTEKIEVAASKIITPPELGAIQTSLKNLQDLNALDASERLTPLGHHLARMPVDARVGKMLLFGCMLRCLDPVLTIAAALSGRTPFLSPMDKREEASAARLRFAGNSKSDHLTIVGAYNGWQSARQEGRNAESSYCTANFLSRETLVGIEASRQDFFKILADIGFLPEDSKRMDQIQGSTELDSNASSIRVVKAVICAGFYPNIVRVIHPEKTYVQTEGGTVAKIAAARELRFFTKADGRVFLHPASVNFPVGKFESPWLVFSEKMKTSKVFLKDSTMVPAYGLLLFGGKVQVKHEKQAISVDDWLEFEAPARIAVLIKELRAKVDSLLFEKIERPALDISSSPVVSALIRLLTTDGF